MAKKYDASSIEVLEGLEPVRRRPGMYIPDVGIVGLHHLIKEVMDNSIDEFQEGHCTQVKIQLYPDGSISIADNARGIPVAKHPVLKEHAVTLVLTQLHAGAKFDKESYKISAGLHGVGASVVNALSEWFEVEVCRDGHRWKQRFQRGTPDKKLQKLSKIKATGTKIRFKPDSEIFETVEFEIDMIRRVVEQSSFLCKGLKFVLISAEGKKEVFQNNDGIVSIVNKHVEESGIETTVDTFLFENDSLEVAMAWTTAEDEVFSSFVNVTEVPEGGSHILGVRKALVGALEPYAANSANYTPDDLRDGLISATHVRVGDPIFKGQSKHKLLNKEVTDEVCSLLQPELEKFFATRTASAKSIVSRASKLSTLRAKARKEKKALRTLSTKSKNKKGVLPGKLIEAPFCLAQERELFILEGDSASGSAKRARDRDFQEILPIRGKVINSADKDIGQLLKNKEFSDIITAIGSGIDSRTTKCLPEKARVGKVLLLMDADPDGQHIASLIITFLVQFMRPLLEAGMIYVVDSPLYMTRHRNKRYFGHKRSDITRLLPKNATPHIMRLKGHGEANPEDLKAYAMDPKKRKLYRLTIEEAEEDIVLSYMSSKNANVRREILGIVEVDK